MTNLGRGPWQPGRGKTIEAATEQAWEHAKNGHPAAGFAAAKAPAGTYRVEIYVETENPIRGYVVVLDPTGP